MMHLDLNRGISGAKEGAADAFFFILLLGIDCGFVFLSFVFPQFSRVQPSGNISRTLNVRQTND